MTQTMSIQSHPDAGLCKVLTTTYKSGAQSKRYLDAQGMPFDVEWVKPLNVKPVDLWDIIEHREVELYNHYLTTGSWK